MTRQDARVRLLSRGQRPADFPTDERVASRIVQAVGQLGPDPLFRRRLRGQILNQHVAVREGLLSERPSRQMGRLGRSVLVASLALAVTAGSVGAVSQSALPGDALYPVKRQLEELRLRVAPASLREALELGLLDERLDEVERLAAADRWSDLPAAVDAVLVARGGLGASDVTADAALSTHAAVLESLLSTAPPAARDGIQRALGASSPEGRPRKNEHPNKPAVPGAGAAPAPAPSTRPSAQETAAPSTRPSDRPRASASASASASESPAEPSRPADAEDGENRP